MLKQMHLSWFNMLFFVLCMTGCSSAPVSSEKVVASSFQPKIIFIVGIMGDESTRGTDSFDRTISEEFWKCGIHENGIYMSAKKTALSLGNDSAAFEGVVKNKIALLKPDSLLELTAVSSSQNNSLLTSSIVASSYEIHLTDLTSQQVLWVGHASDGDVFGIDSRAELAKNIVDRLKRDGIINSCAH